MKIANKGKAIELLNNSLPYPEQMKNIDLDKEDSVYFDWRSSRYKLELQFAVIYMVDGMCLEGNDASLLMSRLIQLAIIKDATK